jgi:hypothetical protein
MIMNRMVVAPLAEIPEPAACRALLTYSRTALQPIDSANKKNAVLELSA